MSLTITVATSGPTPSAGDQTFGSMKADVAAIVGMHLNPKKLSLAGQFIRDCIDDLNRKQVWGFNLITSSPITTSNGVASYAIPSNFWKLYNTRKTNDTDYQFTTMRLKNFDTIFVSQRNIQGNPYIMVIKNTFRDGTVTLFPIPSGGQEVTINYYKLISKPASDGDFLDLPLPYQTVVKYSAMFRMAAHAKDREQTALYKELFGVGYAEMARADDDIGDEDLRFVNIEELADRAEYSDVASRPRAYDLF